MKKFYPIKKETMRWAKGVLCFLCIFVVCLICNGCASKEKKMIDAVKNGYLGNYDTVSVDEVLCRDGDTWKVEDRLINGKEQSVVCLEKESGKTYVFQVTSDMKSFEVCELYSEDDTYTEKSMISTIIDMNYYSYSCAFPDKGIVINPDNINSLSALLSTSSSYKGTAGKLKKVENEYMYDMDFGSALDKLYFQTTMDDFGLTQEEYDNLGTYVFSDKKGILSVELTDDDGDMDVTFGDYYSEESVAEIYVSVDGSRNISPSVNGIRIGDNAEDVKEKLDKESDYRFLSDKETENDILEFRTFYYSDADGGTYAFLYYPGTGAIFSIRYLIEKNVYEMQEEGYYFTGGDTLQLASKEGKQKNEQRKKEQELSENDYIDSDDENPEEDEAEDAGGASGNTAEAFIGISGTYQCGSDPQSGVIDVYVVDDNLINIAIGTHSQQGILGGTGGGMPGNIIDSNTAVIDWGSCVFTLTWTDTGLFTITREGSSGIQEVDVITNNVEYVNSEYYHVS